MVLLHPLQPAIVDAVGDLGGNVVDDHNIPGCSSRYTGQ
jgi:hypothetical protein